jgi:hypothetical protein
MTVKPSIHLNGSGREHLVEQYCEQYNAIMAAVRILDGTGPNARDYYIQSAGAFEAARDQHGSTDPWL